MPRDKGQRSWPHTKLATSMQIPQRQRACQKQSSPGVDLIPFKMNLLRSFKKITSNFSSLSAFSSYQEIDPQSFAASQKHW